MNLLQFVNFLLSLSGTLHGTNAHNSMCSVNEKPDAFTIIQEERSLQVTKRLPYVGNYDNDGDLRHRLRTFYSCSLKNYTIYLAPIWDFVLHPSTTTVKRCHTGHPQKSCKAVRKARVYDTFVKHARDRSSREVVELEFEEDVECYETTRDELDTEQPGNYPDSPKEREQSHHHHHKSIRR